MEPGGPHVSIVFAQVDGYGVELERTFFLGAVPESAKAPFEAMFEARALAYELAGPGVNLPATIDTAVRQHHRQIEGTEIAYCTGTGSRLRDHRARGALPRRGIRPGA